MQIIEINSPAQISSKRVLRQVNELVLSGVKTNDIVLQMNYVTSEQCMNGTMNDFRKIKNRCAFEKDLIRAAQLNPHE